MKKRFPISEVSGGVLILVLATLLSSCKVGVKAKRPQFLTDSLVAHFDYFKYKGNDDYYNENPLPGEDYFYNPILPGWYSDPSIASNGKDYFMVTSTFSFFPGVPLFHSTDLMNWKQVGHVLDRPDQLPLDGQKTSEGIFAPAISYNPYNQTWYMVTTNIKKGNFFVKTKDPFGSWSDPIWLPDVHGIDPSFFFDDNGKAYIVNNDVPDGGSTYDGHRAIRVLQFDVETEKTFGESIMLVNGGVNLAEKPIWIEGPHLYKIDGKYYLMCAEGGTSVNHREVIFKSSSPLGVFVPWHNNPILTQKNLDHNRELPITCAGHADLIRKENGQWWAAFLACRPIENKFENLGRETFLMPVRWSQDGFPYITESDELVPRIIRMEGVKRNDENATFGNFERIDGFDKPELGMEWMTIRGAAKDLYSLDTDPGYLLLKCADVASNEIKELAYVSRRIQHHKFACSTRLYFNPTKDSESAGLLMYKDETHQYLMVLSKKGDGLQVSLKKVNKNGAEIIITKTLENNGGAVDLKITSNGLKFGFEYAEEGAEWKTLANNVDAFYLSTAQSYGFTGTNIGVYASSKEF